MRNKQKITRWGGAVAAVGALSMSAGLMAQAAPAPAERATDVGYYTISKSTAKYNSIKVNNLFPNSVDDSTAALSISGTGAYKMPFPVWVYNLKMRTMSVSSNGNIQFWTNTDRYDNTCLPSDFGDSSGASGRAIAVFWDDLYIDRAKGDGVFTQTTGAAGRRQFTIAWQGRFYGNRAMAAKASVTFFENSKNIKMSYGTGNTANATIGVQLSTTPPKRVWTEYSCNPGTSSVKANTVLNFIHRT